MFLLDTNICIYLIKKQPLAVLEKLMENTPAEIGISSITVAELEYGVQKSRFRTKNQTALMMFLQPFEIFPFTSESAIQYGIIRNRLEREGSIIGAMDLLIAAQALELDRILVTNNEREFKRVPNLKIQNWTKDN
ncbi:MAG: type II toxin-antitoxin system VapC family toxin [FCB group bacterium]|nr:type II toxin-antitoxin system VapC family toxin [FCB group bacterium]